MRDVLSTCQPRPEILAGTFIYADTVPTLNNILRRIEGNVADSEAMNRVEQVVRSLIKGSTVFEVHANIDDSEAIPDKTPKPQLGILAFEVEEMDPARFIERRGDAVREYQNQVFLLTPSISTGRSGRV